MASAALADAPRGHLLGVGAAQVQREGDPCHVHQVAVPGAALTSARRPANATRPSRATGVSAIVPHASSA